MGVGQEETPARACKAMVARLHTGYSRGCSQAGKCRTASCLSLSRAGRRVRGEFQRSGCKGGLASWLALAWADWQARRSEDDGRVGAGQRPAGCLRRDRKVAGGTRAVGSRSEYQCLVRVGVENRKVSECGLPNRLGRVSSMWQVSLSVRQSAAAAGLNKRTPSSAHVIVQRWLKFHVAGNWMALLHSYPQAASLLETKSTFALQLISNNATI